MTPDAHGSGLLGRPASRRGALALLGAAAIVAASSGRAAAQDDQNQGLGAAGRFGEEADASVGGGMAEVQGVGGSGRTGGQMAVTAMPATGAGAVQPNVAGAALLAAGALGAAAVALRAATPEQV